MSKYDQNMFRKTKKCDIYHAEWQLSWLKTTANVNFHFSPDPSEDVGEFGRPPKGFLQTSKSLRHVGGELLLFSDDHRLSRFQSVETPAPAAWVWNKWITMTHVCVRLQTCAEHLSFCLRRCVYVWCGGHMLLRFGSSLRELEQLSSDTSCQRRSSGACV